ncbi:MAG: circadian clock KaiB family protein [Bacteroidetes bacterium]|nr:circadian clock KaiB family protein [Bacteroidota bacterium]
MSVKNNARVKTGPSLSPLLRSAQWDLNLYISGTTTRSVAALQNLKQICKDQLKTKYRIKVIDLAVHPESARDAQIIAIPTLVRKYPLPEKNIIGDLSDEKQVMIGLDIPSRLPA